MCYLLYKKKKNIRVINSIHLNLNIGSICDYFNLKLLVLSLSVSFVLLLTAITCKKTIYYNAYKLVQFIIRIQLVRTY